MNEQALWRAVINRALDDARGNCGGDTIKNRDRFRDEARSWFQTAGRDFRRVCDLADLNADWVRTRALQEIAQNQGLVGQQTEAVTRL